MRVGDVLEWFAGAAFVTAAYLATHRPWTAVVVAGVCLAYLAQCHGTTPFPKFTRPTWFGIPNWLRVPGRKAKS